VAFNVAFVSAAAVSALVLPADGRSSGLILTLAVFYAATAVSMTRVRDVPRGTQQAG